MPISSWPIINTFVFLNIFVCIFVDILSHLLWFFSSSWSFAYRFPFFIFFCLCVLVCVLFIFKEMGRGGERERT